MKIVDHISGRGERTLFSFEILPPLKGGSITQIWDAIDPLMEFKPSFIDVTYHREDYIMRRRSDGGFDRLVTRKRPGTVGICAGIQNKYKVDAVPHLICGGFTKEDTENALIDLHFVGIDNILALRGDARKEDRFFVPEEGGNKNALDLIYQISNMNNGIYLDETLINATVTNFCTGTAGYPEKHADAPNLESDLNFLKRKVDAGAQFIVTQMFFDNKHYFQFEKRCREKGIHVPIIPGIKPLSTKKQMTLLPNTFNIEIPYELSEVVESCKDDGAVREAGIEWCINQCRELVSHGVPVLHFYTMGKSESIRKIASAVY
jgi:methylenetetrahydrofolate reductase (NADPH)